MRCPDLRDRDARPSGVLILGIIPFVRISSPSSALRVSHADATFVLPDLALSWPLVPWWHGPCCGCLGVDIRGASMCFVTRVFSVVASVALI